MTSLGKVAEAATNAGAMDNSGRAAELERAAELCEIYALGHPKLSTQFTQLAGHIRAGRTAADVAKDLLSGGAGMPGTERARGQSADGEIALTSSEIYSARAAAMQSGGTEHPQDGGTEASHIDADAIYAERARAAGRSGNH